jgi:hypothetical protein
MTVTEFFDLLPRCGPWQLVDQFEQNAETNMRGYEAVIRAKQTKETPILHAANVLGHRCRSWIFRRKFRTLSTEGLSR